MSLLNVKFSPFPSLLTSPSASSSMAPTSLPGRTRSWCQSPDAPARWRESSRIRSTIRSTSPTTTQISGVQTDVTMISSSARGMPNSEALSSSRKAAASNVSFLFGHTCWRETGVGHVSSRSSHQETGVELNRESVATTLFQFTVESEKRSRVEFCACVWEIPVYSPKRSLERKIDLAIQGEKEDQQKLYLAVKRRWRREGWEKRTLDHAFQEINQEFEPQRFRLNQAMPKQADQDSER